MKCNQQNCAEFPKYRFTWPGEDKDFICEEHSKKLLGVASAMGMHLELIEIDDISMWLMIGSLLLLPLAGGAAEIRRQEQLKAAFNTKRIRCNKRNGK